MEEEVCVLCKSNINNELEFGKLLTSEGITVHHYCLLFAPGLSQRGADNEGILGFLIEDIQKEVKGLTRRLNCFFCKKSNANLGCCRKTCPKAYHTACAMKEDISFEFSSRFPTYCRKHKRIKQKQKPKSCDTCSICLERVTKSKAILIPCCKNSWFHKTCLQKFSNTSGVYFKCPLCNDKKVCTEVLPLLGIFLPEKDADWEYDIEAYEDLNETPWKSCEAEKCKSSASFQDSPWLWKLCSTCGSSAIHLECMTSNDEFVCESCSEILNKPKQEDGNLRINVEKKPEVKKRKFNPWFSDDEQWEEADENAPPIKKAQKRGQKEIPPDIYRQKLRLRNRNSSSTRSFY